MGTCDSQTRQKPLSEGNQVIIQENPKIDIDAIKFYDVIVPIESITDITKGWEIKLSDRLKKNYDYFISEKVLKIGIIGNSNKGKSFILSKLSKINLPSGTSIKTVGLSIKYPDLSEYVNRRIVLLDSAGLETPVLSTDEEKIYLNNLNNNLQVSSINKEGKNENELFKEKSRDKMVTERFLQDYIIYNSDILIIVVGILTYSEQKTLNKIRIKLQREKLNKKLFIIHNLTTYTSIIQVQKYIEETLKKSATFELEKAVNVDFSKEIQNGICFHEKNIGQEIYHLIFANDYSEAGKYYNENTLKFIKQSFNYNNGLTGFDIVKTIKERFIEESRDIIELGSNDNLVFADQPNTLIKLEKPNKLKLKKFFIDELGFQNMKIKGFSPNYCYYKTDNSIVVIIEVPGNFNLSSDIQYSGEYAIIKLDGRKEKDAISINQKNVFYTEREFGNFSLNIPIKQVDFVIKNEKPMFESKDGILTLSYKIEKSNGPSTFGNIVNKIN